MKCFYKIIMENGDEISSFVPESLKKTDQDMFYFDYFAYACKDANTFYKQIKKLASIKDGEIKSVIDYKRDKNNRDYNPYNIVFDNPYLKRALDANYETGKYNNIKRKKVRVLGKNVFDDDVVVIDKNTELYNEMCNYLFDNLRNNKDVFFKSIYNRKNDYSIILKQYAELYESVEKETASGEEINELAIKERDIKDHLSKYKTFRSLAICRYNYEQRLEEKESKKEEKERLKEEKKTLEELAKIPQPDPMDGLKDVSDYFERYNQEHEEYIEPGEYQQMSPEGSVPISPENSRRK